MSLFKRSMAALVAMLCLMGIVAVPARAEATARAPKCAAELGLTVPTAKEAAKQTPVVMVHGWTGRPATWTDKPSMWDAVESIPAASVVKLFDYHASSTDWVTEGDTAHRLARTIVCAYKLYDKRVILLAHSMGGLLARAALSWAADGVFAKKAAGLVITIGTPHKGLAPASLSYAANISLCNVTFAWWGKEASENCERIEGSKAASAMRPGSPQLAALPKFPDGVAVKAIAGEVSWQVCLPWGSCAPRVNQRSDLLVSVESATDEYTDTGHGDGNRVFKCVTSRPIATVSDAWCDHNNIVHAGAVLEEVKRSIQEYLTSLTRPQGRLVTTFGHLSFRIPDGLDLKPFHGEGYTSYELLCGDTLGGQNGCPKLSVYNPHEAGGDLGWQNWGWREDCGADKPVRSGVMSIGGRSARAYVAGHCRFWEMSDNSALIIATDPPGSKQAGVVDRVVATAMWN